MAKAKKQEESLGIVIAITSIYYEDLLYMLKLFFTVNIFKCNYINLASLNHQYSNKILKFVIIIKSV